MKKNIKILCIGNSFSVDTTKRLPEVAAGLGVDLVIGNLFVPGCPIDRHYEHIINDTPIYKYHHSDGCEWTETPDYKISDAIHSDDWDYISIQHGSSYGQSYIRPECYDHFPALVQEVRALASNHTKVVFNMTWTGEPTHNHKDMLAFDRDQDALFAAICAITEQMAASAGIDRVIPTGTAIHNARTANLGYPMTRDGYHLNMEAGRYLAALTFLCALTGICPGKATEQQIKDQPVLIKAAELALRNPYKITPVLEHMYLYETHLHTAPVSKCGKVSVRENLEFYKSMGYAGVFITNHFIDGNINIDKTRPYEELIEFYCSDYEEALRIGKELGISVFFGIESSYKGTDFLIYGLDKTWLLQHPEIRDIKKSEQLKFFMDEGALVIQTHPFYEASYIDHVRLFPRHVHGVEVYNARRTEFHNTLARQYAEAYDLIPFAGTDNHHGGEKPLFGGMQTATALENEAHFVQLVLTGQASPFHLERKVQK